MGDAAGDMARGSRRWEMPEDRSQGDSEWPERGEGIPRLVNPQHWQPDVAFFQREASVAAVELQLSTEADFSARGP